MKHREPFQGLLAQRLLPGPLCRPFAAPSLDGDAPPYITWRARLRQQREILSSSRPNVTARAASANSAASSSSGDPSPVPPGTFVKVLPRTPEEMVESSQSAFIRAARAGLKRQVIKFLLPVDEKAYDFMATEPIIDSFTTVQQEFDACVSLTKAMLRGVAGPSAEIRIRRIDEGGLEGEPCAIMYPKSKELVAVVFPVAENLSDIETLAKQLAPTSVPLVIVNPQWRLEGQVVSDFGFGPWRQRAEEFLGSFEATYNLQEVRVGNPGSIDLLTGDRVKSGGVVRTLRVYPDVWGAHAINRRGEARLLRLYDARPSYKDLARDLKEAGPALEAREAGGHGDVLRSRESGGAGGSGGGPLASSSSRPRSSSSPSGADLGSSYGGSAQPQSQPTQQQQQQPQQQEGSTAPKKEFVVYGIGDEEIDTMDAPTLRRYLGMIGLPTSGKIATLRSRLKVSIGEQRKAQQRVWEIQQKKLAGEQLSEKQPRQRDLSLRPFEPGSSRQGPGARGGGSGEGSEGFFGRRSPGSSSTGRPPSMF